MATATENKPAAGNQMAIRRDPRVSQIQDLLVRSKEGLQQALPRHMTAERMIRVAVTAIQKVPKLLECDARSLIGAIVEASQLGLEPDGVLGHAYLVPYTLKKGTSQEKTICQLIVGYKGLIDLTRRTGTIKTIDAHVVYEKDEFDYEFGLVPKLKHKPSRELNPGKVIYAYAVGHMNNGGVQFEVMNLREIEAIRSRSRAAKSGPWITDWEAMAKKTVLRRLAKLLPVSVEAQRAIALDERDDTAVPPMNLGVGLTLDLPEAEVDDDVIEAESEESTEPQNLDQLSDKLESEGKKKESPAPQQEQQQQAEPPRPSVAQMTAYSALRDEMKSAVTMDDLAALSQRAIAACESGSITADQCKVIVDQCKPKDTKKKTLLGDEERTGGNYVG